MPRVQVLLDVTVTREVDAPDFTGADLVHLVTGILQRAIPKRIPLSPKTTLVAPGPVKPSVVVTFGHASIGIVGESKKPEDHDGRFAPFSNDYPAPTEVGKGEA